MRKISANAVHRNWCDYMVEKASTPKFYGGLKREPQRKTGVHKNNYSNTEFKKMFEKALTF